MTGSGRRSWPPGWRGRRGGDPPQACPQAGTAPAAYDLTELQRDANKKYAYSAKETLAILQNLYEIHKVVTYPRTDSRYIPDDVFPPCQERSC